MASTPEENDIITESYKEHQLDCCHRWLTLKFIMPMMVTVLVAFTSFVVLTVLMINQSIVLKTSIDNETAVQSKRILSEVESAMFKPEKACKSLSLAFSNGLISFDNEDEVLHYIWSLFSVEEDISGLYVGNDINQFMAYYRGLLMIVFLLY
jgi:hypothetical protein